MQQIEAGINEAGQRLDKLLGKYLDNAPKSFIYKMLRKKNIKLNGKKAEGNEIVAPGDVIALYLADDTISSFQKKPVSPRSSGTNAAHNKTSKSDSENSGKAAYKPPFGIVYEDDHLLLINKPCGMLSQKAKPSDVSLNEYMLEYLMNSGSVTSESLRSFKPGICNRLDRNTSGLVIGAKTLPAAQKYSEMLRDRSMGKFYRCIISGIIKEKTRLEGYLHKDERTNKVTVVSEKPSTAFDKNADDYDYICTEYIPIEVLHYDGKPYTFLEVHLITGKTHQIRAHLASAGCPLIGDGKYGNEKVNEFFRREYGLKHQLLHAYRLEMDDTYIAEYPKQFARILKGGR